MRFRATTETTSLLPMLRLLTCMHSISPRAVLLMTETEWKFHVSNAHVTGNTPQLFGNIAINHVFSRYVIESKSSNEIMLDVDMSHLLRVFQVCAKADVAASEITLKLTTKHGIPLLAFCIWTANNETLLVSQGVPVIPIAHVKKYIYDPPKLSAPDAQIKMPELRAFKNMLDKMQSVSEKVTFKLSHDGKCEIQVDNDWAKIETVYQELAIESTERLSKSQRQKVAMAKVSIKPCIKIIQALQRLEASLIVLCLIHRTALTFYAKAQNDSSVVTFYLGALLEDMNESDDSDTEMENKETSSKDNLNQTTQPTGETLTNDQLQLNENEQEQEQEHEQEQELEQELEQDIEMEQKD